MRADGAWDVFLSVCRLKACRRRRKEACDERGDGMVRLRDDGDTRIDGNEQP